jgi:aryl-alcohol dehydrogenase-like predicted oxidoreductase
MQMRRLGDSDLSISRVGFGAWAIGGGQWVFGWGPQDDAESIAAIQHAVERGVNWIDTAAVYGLGRSEEVVRRAVANIPSARRPYIFTKCSLVWDSNRQVTHTLKSASIRREIDDSLRRLGVDAIDLYQVHWPTLTEGDGAPDIEEGWRTMADLKRAGKVRYIGVSNFDVPQMQRAEAILPITSLQPPYSMLTRDIEREILPYCQRQNIGVIVYSPMQSGLLTGAMTRERIANFPEDDWRRTHPDYKEPRLTRNLALVEGLRAVGARHGRSVGEIAVAWTLHHPAVTAAIVGARRPSQVDGWIGAGAFQLPDSEMQAIERLLPAV